MKNIISKLLLCSGTASMALALLLALSGCGGSDGAPVAASGATPGVSVGTVAKSVPSPSGQQITVNNVTFATANSSVTMNGDPAAVADVKPGMQVTIAGTADGMNGSAVSIEIEGELEGMVEQINSAAGSMVVLGQTVLVNNQTVFEGAAGLSDLSAGQMVEVHGLPGATGVIEATRVEVKLSSRPHYLSGPISKLDTAAKTFSVRTVTINYAGARIPLQPLANGQTVKVKGTYTNGVLNASSIRTHHVHLNQGHAELEGVVADYDAVAGTFTLHGQPAQLSATTSYSHGTASDIANGVKVEVKGEVVNGILAARKIEIEGVHGAPTPPPATPTTTTTTTTTTPTTTTTIPTTTTTTAPPAPTTLPGKAVYDSNCAGCHALGTYDSTGSAPNLSGKGGAVTGKITGGHNGISLSSTQLTDLTAFVTAN